MAKSVKSETELDQGIGVAHQLHGEVKEVPKQIVLSLKLTSEMQLLGKFQRRLW